MPIYTKTKSFNGTSGLAEVRVLADSLRVIFADGDTYQVKKDGWDRPSGMYKISLNRANDAIKLSGPAPRDEPFITRFLEYANRVGKSETNPGVPEPKIKAGSWKNGRGGQQYFDEGGPVAYAKFEVVEKGPYKGMVIIYEVPYIFEQYQGTMSCALVGTKGQQERVEKFLELTGFNMLTDDIPFSGNVLPLIEAKQQAANNLVAITLNEAGFVAKDGMKPVPSWAVTPDMFDDEPKAKKVAAKKAPAKKVAARRVKATK